MEAMTAKPLNGIKQVNKVTRKQRFSSYKRTPLSLLLYLLVLISTVFTAGILIYLIGYILVHGVPYLTKDLFSLKYTSTNVSLFPAMVNTVSMTALALLFAVPLGIFSAVMRTSEEALKSVPDSFREGSFGLGAGKLRTVFQIVLPSAVPGILSGVILAVGRIVGETAALMYTAGTVAEIPSNVMGSGRTLSVHMYALSSEGLHVNQSYATAVVLLIVVIVINAVSTFIAKRITKG